MSRRPKPWPFDVARVDVNYTTAPPTLVLHAELPATGTTQARPLYCRLTAAQAEYWAQGILQRVQEARDARAR